MSTIAHTPEVTLKRGRVGMIVTALVALVVIAGAVLVVSFAGASHPALVPRETGARYVPLIQYHGTGSAPQTAGPAAVAHNSAPGYIRHEQSYGMVP